MTLRLSPTQQQSLDQLQRASNVGNLLVLFANTGLGRSTVLREIHREWGGAFLDMKDFVDAMRGQHPFALEETFEHILMDALATHDTVIVDDLHLLNNVVCCNHFYPRTGFLNAPLMTISSYAIEARKKLIFGDEHAPPPAIHQRAFYATIRDFDVVDYEFLCHQYLEPGVASRLDYDKMFRFATKLNAHQLKAACMWLNQESELDTARFIEYLRSQRLASNVDLSEVQLVDIHELKGVDDVIKSLEANIILPLENEELATELGLRPKRGVLLAGPPGTGKTTIGRALAHRLKGKFFIIDGTFIAGSQSFYGRIHQVFEAARQNAPSIIFIDDSDAIFESGEELGLYRYLLTALDGLESESAGRVCIMLTAMDVGNLPPALVRSGRIELWLEMQLPDNAARAAILSSLVNQLPTDLADTEPSDLVQVTEGFTGADLKRLIEDGKNLYAYEKAQGQKARTSTQYFLMAVETVRANKEKYAEAEAKARQQRPARPPWFTAVNEMMTFVEDFNKS